jgi:molecular chaperone GrpE
MSDDFSQKPAEAAVTDPPDARNADETAESPAQASAPNELATLQQERDELYDRLLRKTAEFDNYRKRVDRERREQAEHAATDLLLDILSVADDFERALAVESGEGATAYRQGVELIHTKLMDVLRKRGVTPIDVLGADFDPNLHQAVVHESHPDHREGQVIGELRRGYRIGDKLLRPAMVKVAKA